MMELVDEPGWTGTFTRYQAKGAIPNGTRIVKAVSEPGDGTPDGTLGTVLGSIPSPAGGVRDPHGHIVKHARTSSSGTTARAQRSAYSTTGRSRR